MGRVIRSRVPYRTARGVVFERNKLYNMYKKREKIRKTNISYLIIFDFYGAFFIYKGILIEEEGINDH